MPGSAARSPRSSGTTSRRSTSGVRSRRRPRRSRGSRESVDRDGLAAELVGLAARMERLAAGDPSLLVIVAETMEAQRGRALPPHVTFLCDTFGIFLDAIADRFATTRAAHDH